MVDIVTGNATNDTLLQSAEVQTAIQTAIDAEVSGLKAKRDELITSNNKLKTDAATIESLGGVAKFQEMSQSVTDAQIAIDAANLKQAEADGDIGKIKLAHQTQVQELQTTIDNLKSNQVKDKLGTMISAVVNEQNGIPELLMPLINGRVKGSLSETGAINYEVVNSDGTLMLKGEGGDATLQDLVTSLRQNESFTSAFKGTQSSGMNSREGGDVTAPGGDNLFDRSKTTFSLTKAMAFYKSNPEKAKIMAKQVGFALSS